MNKIRVLVIVLAVVGLATALSRAFWDLDFYVARSESRVDAQIATTSNTGGQRALREGGRLHLYVNGKSNLARSLREELRAQIEADGRFAEVALLDQPEGSLSNTLAVEVDQQSERWSGVYAQADVRARISFSITGDIYYPGQPTHFTREVPGAVIQGTIQMADTTYGLTSNRGYERALGRQLAREIARSFLAEIVRHSA